MAKGRMLNKKISLDEAVDDLSCDTSRLLFSWLISHLDYNGCYFGDAEIVKSNIFPLRKDISAKKIERFLQEMEKKYLIIRYWVGKMQYLFMPSFDKNQPNLRKDREANSDIPPYPELLRSNDGNIDGNHSGHNRTKQNLSTTEVEVEEKGNSGVNPEKDNGTKPEWLLLLSQNFKFSPEKNWSDMIERAWGDIDLAELVTVDFIPFWKGKKPKDIKSAFLDSLKHARDHGQYKNKSPDKYTRGKYGHMVQQ